MSAEHVGSESASASVSSAKAATSREDLNSARSILPPLRESSTNRGQTGGKNKTHNDVTANSRQPTIEEGTGKARNEGGEGSKVVTRENTKTEVQSLGMGKKTATLYLSRTHTMMKGRTSSQALKASSETSNLQKTASRAQTARTSSLSHTTGGRTSAAEEEELLSAVGLRAVQREFTFTGYEIEEDNEPPENKTPDDLDEEERLKRKYCRIYIDSCRKFGVLPVAPVANSIADSHVVLKTRGLGVKGARAIATALVGNKKVKSLDLEDNWIGADGAVSIASMTLGNDCITEINISENRIGTKGIRAICEALAENRTIRKLDVSGSNLFDHDAKYIAMLLESNFCLQELKARNNKFGELGGLYLGPAIANNEFLQVLDLCWNHLRGKGAFAVAAGIGANVALKVIDLSWNGFCSKACKILGDSLLENISLRELDLTRNRINAEGVGGIMKGVQANHTLTALRVGQNPFTPDVATIILRAIVESESSDIRELDLTDIVVEEDFMKLLSDVKKKRLLLVKHGPVIKKGESMMKEGDQISGFTDPVQALYEYMSQKGYRVIDLFKRFDTDRSMSVTRDEFYSGLVQAHVPMTVGQLEDLMEKLDKNKDGQVDLKELMDGEKLFRRKSIRKKLRRQSSEKVIRRQRAGSLPDLNVGSERGKNSTTGLPALAE
ncbi:leucine-rich repeat-containing protein 74B [Aplysia californica]|uniref:Leucine-rich repeat-containing protein 74B n=1 Tax=Aplysia californica TaxID=6500 RepID=A0ABM1A8H5_APLCA|nr:leucine-rich repeat-containing protein 74B [Aplysia californica]